MKVLRASDNLSKKDAQPRIKRKITYKKHQDINPINLEALSFEQVLALFSLAMYTWQEHLEAFAFDDGPRNIEIPFAPNDMYGAYLIEEALKTNLILKFDEHKDLFSIDGATIYPQPPNTFLWNMSTKQRQDFIDALITYIEEEPWPSHWVSQIFNIAQSIALAECLEFYTWSINQRKFVESPRSSAIQMILELLDDYSIGQCQSIINEGAKAASDYFVRTNSSALSAAEYMLKYCKKLGKDAKENSTAIPNMEKISELPRCIISFVLYKFFMPEIDDFTAPLDKVKNKINTINQQRDVA